MENFLTVLLRLKEQLGVESDKDVAEALCMSATAFNQRKARGSFPETELLALTARRPDLNLDATYILTGAAASAWERDVLARTAEVVAKMEPAGDGLISQKMLQAYKLTPAQKKTRRGQYNDLEVMLDRCNDDDLAMVVNLAWRLAIKGKP